MQRKSASCSVHRIIAKALNIPLRWVNVVVDVVVVAVVIGATAAGREELNAGIWVTDTAFFRTLFAFYDDVSMSIQYFERLKNQYADFE